MPSPKENWLDTYRGVVHIGGVGGGGEYTVCGLTFDEPSSEHDGDSMEETDLPPTCPDCINDGRILLGTLRRQLRRALVKYAARLREALAAPALAPGNAAAMREALEDSLRFWNGISSRTRREENLRLEIAAALAAPARNCDRFKTAGAAHKAFQRFCRGNYRPSYAAAGLDGCDDCELCEAKNTSGEDACPFWWLFATEKGGAE